MKQKLALYRAAVLKAAVEGQLTAEWRAEHPDVEPASVLLKRILLERQRRWEEAQLAKFKEKGKEPPKGWRAQYKEPEGPDTSDRGELPGSWSWATLDQVSGLITSGSRGWRDYYAVAGSLFVRSQDIRTDQLDLTHVAHVDPPQSSEGLRTRVRRGDLLVTITGANVAKAARVAVELPEAYVSQHVGLVRPIRPELGDFLHAYIVAPSGGRKRLLHAAYGAGKPGLNLDNLRRLCVPIPPVQEQPVIVEAIDGQLSVVDHIEADVDAKLAAAHTLRQAILRHAFTGQLVPQDSNDEPASELLKRIAQARADRVKAASEPSRSRALSRQRRPSRQPRRKRAKPEL